MIGHLFGSIDPSKRFFKMETVVSHLKFDKSTRGLLKALLDPYVTPIRLLLIPYIPAGSWFRALIGAGVTDNRC